MQSFVKGSLIVWIKVITLCTLCSSLQLQAQPPTQRPTQNRTASKIPFSTATRLQLVLRRDVQSELDLIEEQVNALVDLDSNTKSRIQDLTSELRAVTGSQPEDVEERKQIILSMVKLRQEADTEIDHILLPHQLERLRAKGSAAEKSRPTAQNSPQTRPIDGFRSLTTGELGIQLKLTEEQRRQINMAGKDARERMAREMERIASEAEAEIRKVLSADQQAQLDKLVDDSFELFPTKSQR